MAKVSSIKIPNQIMRERKQKQKSKPADKEKGKR